MSRYVLFAGQNKRKNKPEKTTCLDTFHTLHNTKMSTIFMNSENRKKSDSHRLLLNFTSKIDLRRKDKYITLSNLSMEKYKSAIWEYGTWNIQNGMKNLNYGSYSIWNIQDYFEYIFKKHEGKSVSPSIRIYINKIEVSITFKIKAGYYIKLLTPETMKLLGSTKSKVTKNANHENVSYS